MGERHASRPEANAGSIQAIERAAEILFAFSPDEPELGISELARRLRLGKSTVHRLLASLERAELIAFQADTQRYSLGIGVMRLAATLRHGRNLISIGLPHLTALRDLCGETVGLRIRVGDEQMCILKVESLHDLSYREPLGKRSPLYAGASGHLLLALMPPEEAERIIAETEFRPYTHRTITDRQTLLAEIERVRSQGYATSFEERSVGAGSLTVPIRGSDGGILAVLGVAGPVTRLTPRRILELLPLVRETAERISIELGFVSSEESGSGFAS